MRVLITKKSDNYLANRPQMFGYDDVKLVVGKCKAESLVTCSLQNLLRRETDSRTKFDKETIAGVHRRPKLDLRYSEQADLGRAQDAQALLRHAHPRLMLKQQLLTSAD